MGQYHCVGTVAGMDPHSSWGLHWLPWPKPRNVRKEEVRPKAQPLTTKRQAFAEWDGDFKGGKGTVTSDGGGVLKMPYSLATQLAGTPGTDPVELLAAVHAASFCRALVAELSGRGISPRSVHTTATVTLEKQTQGLAPTQLHLDVIAWIPGVERLNFERAADNAKDFWQKSLPFKGRLTIDISLNAW